MSDAVAAAMKACERAWDALVSAGYGTSAADRREELRAATIAYGDARAAGDALDAETNAAARRVADVVSSNGYDEVDFGPTAREAIAWYQRCRAARSR